MNRGQLPEWNKVYFGISYQVSASTLWVKPSVIFFLWLTFVWTILVSANSIVCVCVSFSVFSIPTYVLVYHIGEVYGFLQCRYMFVSSSEKWKIWNLTKPKCPWNPPKRSHKIKVLKTKLRETGITFFPFHMFLLFITCPNIHFSMPWRWQKSSLSI